MIKGLSSLKTWVEVSKVALENNVQVIRRLAQHKIIMAVVKSNAYGHGLVETAKLFLKYGADWIGTDNLDEALVLRKTKVSAPLLVLGYTPVERLGEAARHRIKLTLYGEEILDYISRCKKNIYPIKSSKAGTASQLFDGVNWHLKIDSGMSRQGVLLADLPGFVQRLRNLPEMKIEGVLTHFANADDIPELTYAKKQLANFQEALKIVRANNINPKIIHAAATPAFFSMPEASFDLIRIGIGFYGLWPSERFQSSFQRLGLRPVLSWKTRVVQIKNIKKGTPVGYGITEKVKKDSTIAVLPVGYYDGYFRGLSSVGRVLVGGQSCKILGRVSMNLCVADITEARPVKSSKAGTASQLFDGVNPVKSSKAGTASQLFDGVKVWDEVVLIGRQGEEEITPEEIAQKMGTISYEVVSRINPLLPRIYI